MTRNYSDRYIGSNFSSISEVGRASLHMKQSLKNSKNQFDPKFNLVEFTTK